MCLNGEFETITLVGSTRYPEAWKQKERELTIAGCVVLTVDLFGHVENIDMAGPLKKTLDKVYMQKIRTSDAIYVLNVNGYIGLGACDEILYALSIGKQLYWLNEPSSEELACLAALRDK